MSQSLRSSEVGGSEETIYRVACCIFRERGYHATSMRAIASALDMQPAALYYWYPSKEDLLFNIMETAVDALTRFVQEAIEPEAAAPVRLRQAITAHILTIADHLDELTVFLHEVKSLGPKRREIIQAKQNRYERIFREILRDGVHSGELRDVDPRLGGFMILSACSWLYNWYRPDGPYRPQDIAAGFADMILRGLQPGVEGARDGGGGLAGGSHQDG
jgi:AcrR family transcriptional regulator